jgi:hypothetical protein
MKAAAPFQRVMAASIGKWPIHSEGQAVAGLGKIDGGNFSRR